MVLSVVNLQEAYAKALLVDRDALRAAQAGGRRARRPRGPARRLPHRRPPAVREARARARRRRGPDRAPCAVRLRRPRWPPNASTEPGADADEHRRPRSIDPRRGPLARRRRARTTRSASSCSPRTCSAPNRAVVELRRRQHVGQGHARPTTPAARSTSCGSRARAATWRRWAPEHFTAAAARRDAAADRARRDDRRGHGRLPRALPARPRGAARVDRDAAARVRPGAARRTTRTRTAINVLAGTRRRRAAGRRSASATRPPGSRTSARASRCPSRSARRCATNPDLKLVVLAKHGLSSGATRAEEAYRTHDRGHQPGGRRSSTQRTGDGAALRRRAAGASAAGELARASCCRRSAARSRASARRCSPSTPRARVHGVRLLRAAPSGSSTVGAAVPGPPRAHQARCRCGSRSTRTRRRRARCASGSPPEQTMQVEAAEHSDPGLQPKA